LQKIAVNNFFNTSILQQVIVMRFPVYFFLIPILAALFISETKASVWTEIGDAGDTLATAQITTGSGALTTINGAMGGISDMYKIKLNGGQFSATTQHGSLFLFNSTGHALIGHTPTISASFQAGNYFLALAPLEADPYGYSGGAFVALFPILCGPDSSGCNRYPLSGSANLILDSWGGAFSMSSSGGASYPILMTGASFEVLTAPVPIPAAAWLFGLGLTCVSWFSRKRNKG
jgi:hypothetical protein